MACTMHFCQGMMEEIRFTQVEATHCEVSEVKHCCATMADSSSDKGCCDDQAFMDKAIDQQLAQVLKIKVQFFIESSVDLQVFGDLEHSVHQRLTLLAHSVECNAPPNYISNSQLLFYEG